MTQTIKDFDILDVRVGIFNYRNLKRIDWVLVALVVVLAGIGLVILYSAGRGVSSPVHYYLKQALFFLMGAVLALCILCIDSRFLVSIAPVMYAAALLVLVAVIAFGTKVKGGQRWLALGPFHLQPSEQTKLVVVFMLTWYLNLVKDRIRKLSYVGIAFAIVAVPAALILKQPSLGTALALIPAAFVMVYVAGGKWWHLLLMLLAGLAAAPVAYKQLEEYQRQRLAAFINPEAEPKGPGWQTRQSKITIGSGGPSGKGLCQGTQTRLNYLPEHHTDFIFSLLAEEKGFIGAAVVIGLFAAFLLRGLSFAFRSPDMSGALLAVGVVAILAFHVFVNIAITVGLMPVTGIPLPFLSYGGSFYITTMMGVGVLLHIPVRKQLFD
jgi:rod shape determining protein RodA